MTARRSTRQTTPSAALLASVAQSQRHRESFSLASVADGSGFAAPMDDSADEKATPLDFERQVTVAKVEDADTDPELVFRCLLAVIEHAEHPDDLRAVSVSLANSFLTASTRTFAEKVQPYFDPLLYCARLGSRISGATTAQQLASQGPRELIAATANSLNISPSQAEKAGKAAGYEGPLRMCVYEQLWEQLL